jgi:hypothetical protein
MWQQHQQPASYCFFFFFAAKRNIMRAASFSKEYNDVFGQGNLQCDMRIIHGPNFTVTLRISLGQS